MKIKIARTKAGYISSFVPNEVFASKQDLIRAAEIKLANSDEMLKLTYDLKLMVDSIKHDTGAALEKVLGTIDPMLETLRYRCNQRSALDPDEYDEMCSQLEQVYTTAIRDLKMYVGMVSRLSITKKNKDSI